MKRLRILQAVLLASVVVAIASCGSTREYDTRYYPPRPQTSLSLIIGPSPGLIISRDPYGRYYYRDTYGHIYWRGYDNRYYLDRKYMNRSYYSHRQYNDWRRYHNYRRR